MNIFIDLGCNDGTTVEEFRNWSKIAFPHRSAWTIYAFDPNPDFKNDWERKEDNDTHFIQQAAWIEDSQLELAIDPLPSMLGSSVMPGKKLIWDNGKKIKVKAFDFPEWLKRFASDYVVIKMDIEGAEFPLLERMIEIGTDQICDWLLVEFHPNKVVEYTTTDKLELIDKLKKRDVYNFVEWH